MANKYYIGIDLGGTNIAVGLVDENYKIVVKKTTPTLAKRESEAIVADMARLCREVCEAKDADIKDIANIGIASPGIANPVNGCVEYANNLPFLRFYYATQRINNELVRQPLVVPQRQMDSLRLLCAIDDGNITEVPQNDTHFHQGQEVRITQGPFAGVIGHVARYKGQQRVAVIIKDLITIATAYVPTAFLQPIE